MKRLPDSSEPGVESLSPLLGIVNNGLADCDGPVAASNEAAFGNFLWRLFDDPDRKPLRFS